MLNKQKVYGQTFLTKTRFKSTNSKRVIKSNFVWREDDNANYSLAIIGIINGFLDIAGYTLCLDIDSDKVIHKTYIKRKWWK